MDIYTPTPPDASSQWDDIRPFRDDEIPAAMQRIAKDKDFPKVIDYIYGDTDLPSKIREFSQFRTVSQFQIGFMFDAINAIVRKTTDGFTYSGFENLEKGKGYLFVSNHRDILLDAALLQIALYNNGLDCSEITFGNNLMQPGIVSDFGKSNRMFKVVRNGSSKNFYQTSLHLSSYIRYVLTERNTSVWIAQRNGRTKDGYDVTEQGLLKMLQMSGSGDFYSDMCLLDILPTAISYEFEPCDALKTKELFISRRHSYVKKEGEDLNSIITGIASWKGRIKVLYSSLKDSDAAILGASALAWEL